jgi:hypothetical protein
VIYSLHPDQIGLSLTGKKDHGDFDNNYYGNPYNRVVILRDGQRYSLGHWQRDFPQYDQHSKAVHYPFPEYTATSAGENLITNAFFDTDIAGWSPIRSPKISHDLSQTAMTGGSLKTEYSGSGNLTVIPNTLSVLQDQWYRLKFSVLASNFGQLQLRFNRTAPNTLILEERYFAMDTTRRNYEFFFSAKETTDSAKVLFITDETSAKNYWLDDVTFEPVSARLNQAQDYSKLFINSTESPQVMDLAGAAYVDLEGQAVTQLTLEPFSSKILIYAGDTPPPPSSDLPLVADQGRTVNVAGQFGTATAKFFGGTSSGGSAFTVNRRVSANQKMAIEARIAVATVHLGQTADMLLVMGVEPPPLPYDGGVDTDYVAINSRGEPLPVNLYGSVSEWMPQVEAFIPQVTLQAEMTIKVGEMNFERKSMYYVFVGYRLADGTIVYNTSPITVEVE